MIFRQRDSPCHQNAGGGCEPGQHVVKLRERAVQARTGHAALGVKRLDRGLGLEPPRPDRAGGGAEGGFGLDVALDISLPGVPKAEAQALVEKAHQVCPYSNATRNNVPVRLNVV